MLYPPQAEAIIQAQKTRAVEGPTTAKPQSMTVSTPAPHGLIPTGYATFPSSLSRLNTATDPTPATTFTDDNNDLSKPEELSINKAIAEQV